MIWKEKTYEIKQNFSQKDNEFGRWKGRENELILGEWRREVDNIQREKPVYIQICKNSEMGRNMSYSRNREGQRIYRVN